jgi:hypothetical protein
LTSIHPAILDIGYLILFFAININMGRRRNYLAL